MGEIWARSAAGDGDEAGIRGLVLALGAESLGDSVAQEARFSLEYSSLSLLLMVTSPGLRMAYSLHFSSHASGKKSSGGLSRSHFLYFLRVSMIRSHVGSCC